MLKLSEFLQEGSTNLSNLIIKYYKKIGLNEVELALYLQLVMYRDKGDLFPDMEEIASNMDLSLNEIYENIQGLLTKKAIKMESVRDAQGKQAEQYNLFLIFELISNYLISIKEKEKVDADEQEIVRLYQSFEKEFGRMLSPIERETIGYWIEDDKYSLPLIHLALREAVLNQAYNLKYIDRVLLSWERKNLKTENQVLEELNRRKKSVSENDKQQFNKEQKKQARVPLYNWLDPNNQSEK